ncbi:sugar transferase, partial [Methylobacterium sp. E-046]|nr:sugar transferase [Methylobacterium sp. E-046]
MTKMVDSNVARVAESALPAAPFVVGGLRLDWAAKRSLDVGVAVTALFVLLPLLLLIAVLVWAGDRQ